MFKLFSYKVSDVYIVLFLLEIKLRIVLPLLKSLIKIIITTIIIRKSKLINWGIRKRW